MIKANEKRFVALLVVVLILGALLLSGCGGRYYDSNEFLSLPTKEKIIRVLEREGEVSGDMLVYNIPYISETVECDINLVYSYAEDAFMVEINDDLEGIENYNTQFAMLVYDQTLICNYVGILKENSLIISSGWGTLNRYQLFSMTTLTFGEISGEDYIEYYNDYGLVSLQLAVLVLGYELENYNVDFLGTYFAYYI